MSYKDEFKDYLDDLLTNEIKMLEFIIKVYKGCHMDSSEYKEKLLILKRKKKLERILNI
jgi:hypothetical protein